MQQKQGVFPRLITTAIFVDKDLLVVQVAVLFLTACRLVVQVLHHALHAAILRGVGLRTMAASGRRDPYGLLPEDFLRLITACIQVIRGPVYVLNIRMDVAIVGSHVVGAALSELLNTVVDALRMGLAILQVPQRAPFLLSRI